jgi:dolichol-phosphate mannosyltransferase
MLPKNKILDLSIIIPAYNEERSIKASLENILNIFKKDKIKFELIIINDGSKDNTLDIANKFQSFYKNNNIIIINNINNIGKSASLHKGIKIACGNFITIHDADLEYQPEDLLKMFNIINKDNEIDSVYGSRYLDKKKNTQNKIFYFANMINLYLFNFLFSSRLTDLHSCYKIFKSKMLKNFCLKEKKFGFELEVTTLLIKGNYNILETPILYNARNKTLGKKINFIDEINFLISIFKFRFFN